MCCFFLVWLFRQRQRQPDIMSDRNVFYKMHTLWEAAMQVPDCKVSNKYVAIRV